MDLNTKAAKNPFVTPSRIYRMVFDYQYKRVYCIDTGSRFFIIDISDIDDIKFIKKMTDFNALRGISIKKDETLVFLSESGKGVAVMNIT